MIGLNRVLEWSGSLTGLVGAALLATHSVWSGWGFASFLISNVFWFAFGVRTRTWGLLVMQVGFTATSLMGIYQWLLA